MFREPYSDNILFQKGVRWFASFNKEKDDNKGVSLDRLRKYNLHT